MSLTGLFLITFLIVHVYINAQVFWNDGGARFEELASFMGLNPVIRTIEIGLFALLILHTVQGLYLWSRNRSSRKSRYAVSKRNETSRWYSRSMGLLGTLILLFLIIHIAMFWVPNRVGQVMGEGEKDLYAMMKYEFQNIWIVIIYILGCISLAWHLVHGFFSAFQTLGLATNRYKALIKTVGIAFAIIVPLVFAIIPVAFYLDWIQ